MCAALSAQQMLVDSATINTTPVKPPKGGVSLDVTAIDKSANPCQDFYAYACGNWRKNNPTPADKTRWGRFDELGERNVYTVYQLLEQAANDPKSPLQKKYGDYYAACMNQPLADQLGAKPIQPLLAQVDALNDRKQVAALVTDLQKNHGVDFLYGFGSEQDQKDSQKQIGAIQQAGISLPDRDYYLEESDRLKEVRAQYVQHVQRMFQLIGDTPEQAAKEAQAVMTIETALAKGSTPRVDLRDPANIYHVMTVDQLQAMTPSYDWKAYFNGIGRPLKDLNVVTPNYFKAMDQQLSTASLADLRSYMRWHVVHSFATHLSTPFDQENFAFFQKTLQGQKEQAPLWKRCTYQTDAALGEAVGQDWVAKYFTPEAKANMQQLIDALDQALSEDLKNLDWMGPQTRAEALKKLGTFRRKIGYPDMWRDYSRLNVSRTDRIANATQASIFETNRDLDKIGKPVDEREWQMTPPTVNAYYDPSNNDINFPAGILQPPFYDFKIDPAVNFGAIGVVIGHEMTHGFDDEGSQYDEKGNVRNWFTAEDKKRFDEKTDCEVKEYGNFEPVAGIKLNGKLTLGENTADNGGLRIAYAALHNTMSKQGLSTDTKIDGYTPDQRFFLGFAQVWCENTREETARLRAKTDPHSPGRFRTNGSVQNFDAFGKAFGCKQGDPMYPVNSCRVW